MFAHFLRNQHVIKILSVFLMQLISESEFQPNVWGVREGMKSQLDTQNLLGSKNSLWKNSVWSLLWGEK